MFGISLVCVVLIWSVIRYAESATVQRPWIDVAPKVVPPVDKPSGEYALHAGNSSDVKYWILPTPESWRNTRAAESCAKAAREHERLMQKFAGLPIAQRIKRAPNAMHLTNTRSSVMWAQRNGTRDYETVGETTFAFVDPYETDHRKRMLDVVSAILGDPAVIRPQLETLYGT